VSRLSSQKGLDLLFEAGPTLERLNVQLVVQGLGEPPVVAGLRALAAAYPKHVRLVEEFDADLAQQLYAGADLFLMPSRFEPCGLGQMIAMRYGTIPVVRMTGGLKDTVTDGQDGFGFRRPVAAELMDALERAAEAHKDESTWRALMVHAMTKDFSWDRSAKEYAALYQACVADRLATSA
jgi:starch synthase